MLRFSFFLSLLLLSFSSEIVLEIRAKAMKYVSPNVVSVIMPLSAVVTGVFAVAVGQDTLSPSLVVGAALGLCASFMSSDGDILERKREVKK